MSAYTLRYFHSKSIDITQSYHAGDRARRRVGAFADVS
jgi:hypothetical protein